MVTMLARSLAPLVALLALTAQALPITSSKSSKKSKIPKKDRSSGGGFGAPKRSVPTTHQVDESAPAAALIDFLLSFPSEGMGPESGTQVGTCSQTGIRGIYATRAFSKGDILCKVPSDLALALSDPKGDDVPTVAHAGRNFLTMYVHQAQNSQTWAPYLTSLPTREAQFGPTPDFFNSEELELLEFPRLINMAEQRKRDIEAVAAETEGMSVEDLQFATWLVTSRSFNIQISESDVGETVFDEEGRAIAKTKIKTLCVMVPYLDLVNHHSNQANAEVHIIDPELDDAWFALRATRPIDAGKEITICYGSGADSSVELFSNYGFVPKENKIDAYMLRKGGEDCLKADQWSTTLEEDTFMLAELEDGPLRTILEFRARMKKAYGEIKS
jgi:hypothetical protein